MDKKIAALNLLPVTEEMKAYLIAEYPLLAANWSKYDGFAYVTFHNSNPYFYSKPYIEAHSIEELQTAFGVVTGGA